eukprot:1910024-Rhodomonas_salina.5
MSGIDVKRIMVLGEAPREGAPGRRQRPQYHQGAAHVHVPFAYLPTSKSPFSFPRLPYLLGREGQKGAWQSRYQTEAVS